MRGLWVDEGSDPDPFKLISTGAYPFLSHRDPRVTAAYLDAHAPMGGGIYSVSNWFPGMSGGAYAEHLDAELRRIGWARNPAVCVDIETHDLGFVRAFLARWRTLRPTRPTTWTLEGFQGGLFSVSDVAAITRANVRLAPQFYRGDMSPHEHGVTVDLLIAGFPGDLLDGMYDAAVLPWRWRGFAFTQARVP